LIRSLTRERCERMGRYRRGPEAVLSSPCLAIHPVLRDVDPSRRMMTWESIPSLDDVGIHPVLRDVGHPVLRDVGIHPVLRDVAIPSFVTWEPPSQDGRTTCLLPIAVIEPIRSKMIKLSPDSPRSPRADPPNARGPFKASWPTGTSRSHKDDQVES